jgi:hypothetical protein
VASRVAAVSVTSETLVFEMTGGAAEAEAAKESAATLVTTTMTIRERDISLLR